MKAPDFTDFFRKIRLPEKSLPTCLTFFLIFLFTLLYLEGPLLLPDSISYLNKNPLRSPIYPLLLQLNSMLFGENQYQFLLFLQLALGFGAAIFLAHTLKKLFTLNTGITFLITLILLIPYGWQKFGNGIVTEALCYPVFLFAIRNLLRGVIQKSNTDLFYSMGWTIILILTRKQFLFLYPVFGLLLGYIFFFERRAFKLSILIPAFIASLIMAQGIERGYYYLQHGHFSPIPFTGIQLVVAPLYLAHNTDAHLFSKDNEDLKNIFLETHQFMKNKKIDYDSLPPNTRLLSLSTYTHFYEHYNSICWEALASALKKYKVTDPYQIDALTTQMAFTLILAHLKDYTTLYLGNIIFNLGGFYFSVFLSILFLIFSVAIFRKQKASKETETHNISLAFLITLLLSFGNYTLVALVEPVLKRYTAYTDTLQLSMLIILVVLALRTPSGNRT